MKTLADLGRHERHADDDPRRPVVLGDGDRDGDFQAYEEELAPRGSGWEYVESLNMPGNAERWASLAAEKLTAKSVEAASYDLILEPTNLWLTIHESIGHPTELDRAIGEEANYAGTSFVAPPEKMIGQLQVRPRLHEHPGRSHAGGLAQPRGVGRRGRAGGPVAAHRERRLQGLPDDARAGRVDSEADRRDRGRTAARSPSRGTRCSSSACPTSRCCPASAGHRVDDIVADTSAAS